MAINHFHNIFSKKNNRILAIHKIRNIKFLNFNLIISLKTHQKAIWLVFSNL